jgi:hypothetical protein
MDHAVPAIAFSLIIFGLLVIVTNLSNRITRLEWELQRISQQDKP